MKELKMKIPDLFQNNWIDYDTLDIIGKDDVIYNITFKKTSIINKCENIPEEVLFTMSNIFPNIIIYAEFKIGDACVIGEFKLLEFESNDNIINASFELVRQFKNSIYK